MQPDSLRKLLHLASVLFFSLLVPVFIATAVLDIVAARLASAAKVVKVELSEFRDALETAPGLPPEERAEASENLCLRVEPVDQDGFIEIRSLEGPDCRQYRSLQPWRDGGRAAAVGLLVLSALTGALSRSRGRPPSVEPRCRVCGRTYPSRYWFRDDDPDSGVCVRCAAQARGPALE